MKSKLSALIAIGSSFLMGAVLAPVFADTIDDVQREARNYRIQTYLTHHGDRAAYDHWRNLGDRTSKAWLDAGMPAERAAETAEWFRSARTALSTGGAIPNAPELSTPVKITAVPVPAARQVVQQAPSVPAETVAPVDMRQPEAPSHQTESQESPATTQVSAETSSHGPGAAILRAFARAFVNAE